jgi:hypothetical protein
VPQIVFDKLDAGKGRCFRAVAVGAIFPAEGDGVIANSNDPRIVDCGASDVSAQIFERGSSGTGGLNVHSPILGPDDGINLPVVFFQQTIEVLPKGSLQMREVNEELRVLDPDGVAVSVQSGARNQAMNVRMDPHALVPGVEDGGEAVDVRPKPFIGGELFGECSGNRREEQIVGSFRQRAEEAAAQFGWQSEGDQEIRGVDEFSQFPLNPAAGGLSAALGTGFVVAGVPGEMNVAAGLAAKETSAQCRSAAMGDGPNGAALLLGKWRSRFQELRQKTAQRRHHCGGGAHDAARKSRLTGQPLAELVHQIQSIFGALVRQMQIDHRGGDLLVPEQFLDGVQMRSGFKQMRGEGMAQRMNRRVGNVELLAGEDQQPLQRGARHGAGRRVHSFGQSLRVVVAATDIWKDQERMLVDSPVAAEFLVHGGGQREDPILMSLAVADEQFVFFAANVVDGQG